MKRFLLIMFVVIFPLHAQAFDFHGIKSGMSKDQVSQTLKALDAPAPNHSISLVQLSDDQGLKGVKWSPRSISFDYDHQDRLYSLTLSYPVSLGGPNDSPMVGVHGVAFISALEKKYGATVEINEFFRGLTELEAKVVDDKLLERYLSHLTKEAMGAI